MTFTKYEVDNFTSLNDFGLWWLKMRALLVQQCLLEALEGESRHDASMAQKDKKMLLDKAHSTIVLSLGDRVLRQVSKEKTATELLTKLESLYMTKSLVYMKQALYSFKMSSEKAINEQLNEFNKLRKLMCRLMIRISVVVIDVFITQNTLSL